MRRVRSRARAWAAFLLEGLAAAHSRGLVHGWLLPSLITFDGAGRPLVPPFGGHHLSGLTATHTGGLEELMAVTAPELRGGSDPTVTSDLFALGVLLQWLLDGELGAPLPDEPSPEDTLARALQAEDPAARPSAKEALLVLRATVADVHELGGSAGSMSSGTLHAPGEPAQGPAAHGVVIDVADTWTDALLDALCQRVHPWMQPILDREARRITLAPWPDGCAALGDDVASFTDLLDPQALAMSTPGLESAVRERLRPSSLVRTPAGAWMLALDDLLTR
jgi:serine/threonine protein kinase